MPFMVCLPRLCARASLLSLFSLELLNLIVRRHNLWSEGAKPKTERLAFFHRAQARHFHNFNERFIVVSHGILGWSFRHSDFKALSFWQWRRTLYNFIVVCNRETDLKNHFNDSEDIKCFISPSVIAFVANVSTSCWYPSFHKRLEVVFVLLTEESFTCRNCVFHKQTFLYIKSKRSRFSRDFNGGNSSLRAFHILAFIVWCRQSSNAMRRYLKIWKIPRKLFAIECFWMLCSKRLWASLYKMIFKTSLPAGGMTDLLHIQKDLPGT